MQQTCVMLSIADFDYYVAYYPMNIIYFQRLYGYVPHLTWS